MLTKDQKKALREIAADVTRYILEQIDACKAEEMMSDISISMSTYLREIFQMNNPTLSELAAHMRRSKPSVTIAIDKLESKGYVERVQADQDRRSFHIHLTEKGKRFNEINRSIEEKFDDKISSSLSDQEILQMVALIKKMFR